MPTFDELVTTAESAPLDGWDFSWLHGRATEERPPWGYQRLLGERLARAHAALDLQTGGGEVVAGAGALAPLTVVTEGWPPSLARARALLAQLGVEVVEHDGVRQLPFADGSFDLVTSRHPVSTQWPEVARVLRTGGTFLSQQVGPASGFELIEELTGPLPPQDRERRRPEQAALDAAAAGLTVVDLRSARLRIELFDVAAVVWLLRRLVWWVPGFTVAGYRDRLEALHRRIERDGPFVAHSTRFLIEARRSA